MGPLHASRRLLYAVAALGFAGALDGCASHPGDAQSSIYLERTACLGRCPVYRFTLYSDGRYVWDGREYVSVRGIVRGSMAAKTYATAMQRLRDSRYLEFDEDAGVNQCEMLVTDSPSVTIVVTDGSKPKTINHYLGCLGFPRQQELKQLEEDLDRVFNTRRFSGHT